MSFESSISWIRNGQRVPLPMKDHDRPALSYVHTRFATAAPVIPHCILGHVLFDTRVHRAALPRGRPGAMKIRQNRSDSFNETETGKSRVIAYSDRWLADFKRFIIYTDLEEEMPVESLAEFHFSRQNLWKIELSTKISLRLRWKMIKEK